jgi:predicted GIY-YIG superfamily endonuclease
LNFCRWAADIDSQEKRATERAFFIGVGANLARHSRVAVGDNARRALQAGTQASVNGVTQLVYYELLETMDGAIAREKQLKKWNRARKLRLMEQMNPGWAQIFDAATGEIRGGPFDPKLGAP